MYWFYMTLYLSMLVVKGFSFTAVSCHTWKRQSVMPAHGVIVANGGRRGSIWDWSVADV